ncbi:MAG: hypothetical protein OQJ84_09860 [Xanthomonadales bacterium]|nr:hypothetical protein [Xanthomonadales bacterium]
MIKRRTMPQSGSLTLKLARINDFATPVRVILGLALLAAILSPRPILTSCIVILVCIAGWTVFTLEFSKLNSGNSTVTIFSDGQIRLEFSDECAVAGLLDGQQWSTRYLAILRVKTADGIRYLPLLCSQQRAEDYRRLVMWLRQDICRGASQTRASGI